MNREVAEILDTIANLLEARGESPYRVRAYREAARYISGMPEDIARIGLRGGLQEIPGVGPSIAAKIEEYLNTGRLEYLEELRAKTPSGLTSLLDVPGLGPRRAAIIHQALGIDNLVELEKSLVEGKVQALPGIGKKVGDNILRELRRLQQRSQRMLLGVALPAAEEVVEMLRQHPAVRRIDPAGSIRRRRETIGDIDILVASDQSAQIMEAFVGLPIVRETLARGLTKSSVLTQSNLQIDLRVIKPEEYGSALQYFTGSKAHNIALRDVAIAQGYKLSEYGLFEAASGRLVARETEEDIYRALGLEPMVPELRENRGEIEAAMQGKLPTPIEHTDIRGDMQFHSNWSDGADTLEEMAEECRRLGYEYAAVTEHSAALGVAGGLSIAKAREMGATVRSLNRKLQPFRLLHGAEVDIRSDGTLDYPDELLAELDFVGVSIHSGFGQTRDKMTERVVRALRHPLVNALFHPTGRLIGRRQGFDIDLGKVIEAARETNKALEINAQPDRLDLDDVWARRARDAGVKLMISTDAHSKAQLGSMRYGVFVARRGWVQKDDVINTLPLPDLLVWLRDSRRAA